MFLWQAAIKDNKATLISPCSEYHSLSFVFFHIVFPRFSESRRNLQYTPLRWRFGVFTPRNHYTSLILVKRFSSSVRFLISYHNHHVQKGLSQVCVFRGAVKNWGQFLNGSSKRQTDPSALYAGQLLPK